jgi:hypothetical protein
MITIYCCNLYSKEIDDFGNYGCHYALEPTNLQWDYILNVNKNNGCIATFAHSESTSVLREFFIKPHLNNEGYIKVYGKFSLEHNGEKIDYELVDKRVLKKELL